MVSVLALQQNDQYLELMFVCFFMDFACSPFGCVCVLGKKKFRIKNFYVKTLRNQNFRKLYKINNTVK